jgi:hypothetical protein
VLDLLAHQKLRRFVMKYVLPRQDYFELIPSRSNNFQFIRGFRDAHLGHFPDQTGFFVGLNVFEPVQDFPHDLQVLRALADAAPALKACD